MAGNTLAEAIIELKADTKKLNADLSKVKLDVGNTTKASSDSFNKLGGTIKALGAVMVGVFAANIVKDFFSSANDSASDLQETTGKFKTVFGDQIDVAKELERELVNSFATSTEEARRFLGEMQDLLVPMGVAPGLAANLSGEVVKLSADLGSFNNLPTGDVMRDIQSALVGNFETMKKYGVVLNATVVETKAMELGLKNAKGEIGAAEKAQAALKLIMEGSTFAIGDMERTANSYANQTKKLNALIADQQAALGQALLPAMTEVVGVLKDLTVAFSNNNSIAIQWITTIGQAVSGMALLAKEVLGVKTLLQQQGESALRVAEIQKQIASLGDSFLFVLQRKALNIELEKEQAKLATIIKRRKDEAEISKRFTKQAKEENKARKDIGTTSTKVAKEIDHNAKRIAKANENAADRSLNAWGDYEEERRAEDDASFDNFFNNALAAETTTKAVTDNMAQIWRDVGSSIKATQTDFIVSALQGDLKTADDLWNAFSNDLATIFGTEISKIISNSVGEWIAGEIAKATASEAAAVKSELAWNLAMGVIFLAVALLVTVIIQNFDKIKAFVIGFVNGLLGAFSGILNAVAGVVNIFIDIINTVIKGYNNTIGQIFGSRIGLIPRIGNVDLRIGTVTNEQIEGIVDPTGNIGAGDVKSAPTKSDSPVANRFTINVEGSVISKENLADELETEFVKRGLITHG